MCRELKGLGAQQQLGDAVFSRGFSNRSHPASSSESLGALQRCGALPRLGRSQGLAWPAAPAWAGRKLILLPRLLGVLGCWVCCACWAGLPGGSSPLPLAWLDQGEVGHPLPLPSLRCPALTSHRTRTTLTPKPLNPPNPLPPLLCPSAGTAAANAVHFTTLSGSLAFLCTPSAEIPAPSSGLGTPLAIKGK